jgi:uncharacterized protein with PQ loop repeat
MVMKAWDSTASSNLASLCLLMIHSTLLIIHAILMMVMLQLSSPGPKRSPKMIILTVRITVSWTLLYTCINNISSKQILCHNRATTQFTSLSPSSHKRRENNDAGGIATRIATEIMRVARDSLSYSAMILGG